MPYYTRDIEHFDELGEGSYVCKYCEERVPNGEPCPICDVDEKEWKYEDGPPEKPEEY